MNIFDPMIRINQITLVGCGGTGSQLARTIARMVYDMKQSQMHAPQIRLIDPDKIELKNTGRQLFTVAEAEMQLYKAEAIGRRFNRALGLDIEWITEAVSAERHFDRYNSCLVVGAVDNYEARRELAGVKGLWLDCGNHYNTSQCVLGSTSDRELMLHQIDNNKGKYRHLPNAALIFPALLEPEPEAKPAPGPASCSEQIIAGNQHLLINDLTACIAGSYLYKLLHRQPIHSFLSYASVDTMTVRSIPINRAEILAYLKAGKEEQD